MMRVAFYKAKGNIWDKLIRWWTGKSYSHCELVFSDNQWFSADPRSNGVRYLSITPDFDKWDFAYLHTIDTFSENKIRRWCNSKVGKKYDWLGILLCQFIDVGVEDPSAYFCSEICAEALQQAGMLKNIPASELSPGRLAIFMKI